ncbi:MAG: 2-hydroxychromene-2-carboxylate isomerase [Pseudomonadota bacterium]
MNKLEFYFDCTSPWTYLAFSQIEGIAERTNTQIIWKPLLVGGVFNEVNQAIYEERAQPNRIKRAYTDLDVMKWADLYGLKIAMPSVFPARAVELMRGAIVALDEGKLSPYAWAAFEAYWSNLKDISRPEVMREIIASADLDPDMVMARIQDADVKQRLLDNSRELIVRGGFGSPTMFINGDDMYFGNDRLILVEAALEGRLSRDIPNIHAAAKRRYNLDT